MTTSQDDDAPSTAESLQAVVGAHVMSAAETSGWGPYVESGKLRLLVTFGEKRMSGHCCRL